MNFDLIRGRVDAEASLVAADPPLLRLQQLAGAELGQKIALPALARTTQLALLARRDLRRSILMGDDRQEIRADLHVQIHADGADLLIRNWQVHPLSSQLAAPVAAPLMESKSWFWESNGQGKLIALRSNHVDFPVPADWAGKDVGDIFALQAEAEPSSAEPALWENCEPFDELSAEAKDGTGETRRLILSGQPQWSPYGHFAGYRGAAEWLDDGADASTHGSAEEGGGSLPFNHRMDVALRTPLNRIISSAETISGQFDGPIRADYARYAADIAHAGRHLLSLVDDLSDVQNLEKEDFQILVDRIDLGELARRACGMLQGRAKEKSIRITAPHSIQRVTAMGEYRRVLQILINLITNAVRYSPEGTKIWVEMAQVGALAQISVIDQGGGIPAEDQNKIFEKYERLGRQDEGGSGLGLYIARRLARAMGGDLMVERALPFGARFTLTLPSAP